MQTSGMCPQFSDGVRKTMVGAAPPKPAKKSAPAPVAPKVSAHRAGGHAKHARRGK